MSADPNVSGLPAAEVGADRPDSPPASRTPLIGSLEELVGLRERKGFSASLVSSRLRLSARQVAAIESGDWSALPGRTFIRASLRSYGRLLEADVSPLLDAIEHQIPGAEILKPASDLNRPMPRQGALGFGGSGSGSRWVWLILLLVGVVALSFFYGGGATLLNRDAQGPARAPASTDSDAMRSDGAASSPSPSDAPAAVPAASPSATSTGNTGSGAQTPKPASSAPSGPAQSAAVQPASPPAQTPLTPAQPAPVQPAAAQSAPAQPAPPQSAPVVASVVSSAIAPAPAAGSSTALNPLVLRFPVESWIEVRDGSGAVLVSGTQPPGSVRELSGVLPLSLIIGNAASVAVSWRGVPIDLGPHLKQGIVRFKIE